MFSDLQAQIIKVLTEDVTLSSRVKRQVFDGVAHSDAALPYIVIGDWTAIDDSLLARSGRDLTCNVHIWSSYRGMLEVSSLQERVVELLAHSRLEGVRWVAPLIKVDFDTILIEDSGLRHSITRFRMLALRKETA